MSVLLAREFPGAEIEAFDLAQSADRAEDARLHPVHRGASGRALGGGPKFDLVFWSGSQQTKPPLPRLLTTLVGMVAAGGCLALQYPNDLYEPSRALMRIIAADGPWAKRLLPIAKTRAFNEAMEDLYALLSPICAAVDIWETTYLHPMRGVATIVEGMEATRLAPFLAALDKADRHEFLDRYAAELRRAYPPQPDGRVLLRSRRLFALAQPTREADLAEDDSS